MWLLGLANSVSFLFIYNGHNSYFDVFKVNRLQMNLFLLLLLLLLDIQNYVTSCDGLPQYPRASPRPLIWFSFCYWKKSSPNIDYRTAAIWLCYVVLGFRYSSISSASAQL
jgi:hypothetical protein